MIQYVLLFGLGFLSAILAGLLVAPAIHHRIVVLTERRLKATMPISPAEVRAQKDFVRAEMAVEVARTGQLLTQSRHKAASQQILNDRLSEEAGRLYGETVDLRQQAEEMINEMARLRTELQAESASHESVRLDNARLRQEDRSKAERIEALNSRIRILMSDVDNARIEIATRDTEIEGFKARINALRDERDQLRNDLKLTSQRAKDAELHLARSENKVERLEERLEREVSTAADKFTSLERRVSEIARLKERLKAADADIKERDRLLKKAGIARPARTSAGIMDDATSVGLVMPPTSPRPAKDAVAEDIAAPLLPDLTDEQAIAMTEDVRNQTTALAERLANANGGAQDDKLRAEIADVAAKMIALTAHAEGASSPIRPIIAGKVGKPGQSRVSLAERANRLMAVNKQS